MYTYLSMTNHRLLFYTVWNNTDGLVHASGLSFAGIDEKRKKPKFDKFLTGRYIMEVETGHSPPYIYSMWNR